MTTQPSSARPSRARPAVTAVGLLLAGAVAFVVAGLLGLWAVDEVTSTRLWRVEAVVAPAVVAVGCLAAGWVAASCLVAGACAGVRTAGGAWRGGEVAVRRWAPGLVRRALAVAVAAGVGLGTAAGAHAAVVPTEPATTHVTVDLGWTPTSADPSILATTAADAAPGVLHVTSPAALPTPEPTGDAGPGATPTDEPQAAGGATGWQIAPPAPPAGHEVVVPVAAPVPGSVVAPPTPPTSPAPADDGATIEVQLGDTLWALAARALGADASDAAIAAEWPRWYAANASTIGPDPDLLRPGQVLVVPTAADGGAR